jgi:hypothetical protein
MSNLLVAIYGHPENYPPTLNALEELAKVYDTIYVLYRPHLELSWQYPSNVKLIPSGKIINVKNQERANIFKKLKYLIKFSLQFLKLSIKSKIDCILVYDYIPMICLYFTRFFISNKIKLWYHSHDVAEKKALKKYSIGHFAIKAQNNCFQYLDLFTCPSPERLVYFPMRNLKGEFILLPNFPSISFYEQFSKVRKKDSEIKFIYQGTVGLGHGLEEVCNYMINNNNCELNIVGRINSEYRRKLDSICPSGVNVFHGFVPYKVLPKITASCHIGIAINKPTNIIYQTGGGASNKIYEYAACGLPILYFDNEHYNKYLSKYEWAFATDLSEGSIKKCVNDILNKYDYYSQKAREDFNNDFNFEKDFKKITNFIENN